MHADRDMQQKGQENRQTERQTDSTQTEMHECLQTEMQHKGRQTWKKRCIQICRKAYR